MPGYAFTQNAYTGHHTRVYDWNSPYTQQPIRFPDPISYPQDPTDDGSGSKSQTNWGELYRMIYNDTSFLGIQGYLETHPPVEIVEPGSGSKGETPVYLAITKQNATVLKLLLEKLPSAATEPIGLYGVLPLTKACTSASPSKEIIRILIDKTPGGARGDGKARLPLASVLYCAQSANSVEVAQFLYDAYPQAFQIERSGESFFQQVARGGLNASLWKWALAIDPGAIRRKDSEGNLLLHSVFKAPGSMASERIECIKVLVDAYPEALQVPNQHGRLPLHEYITRMRYVADPRTGREEEVYFLLVARYPEALQYRDAEGHRPLERYMKFESHDPWFVDRIRYFTAKLNTTILSSREKLQAELRKEEKKESSWIVEVRGTSLKHFQRMRSLKSLLAFTED